MNMEFTNAIRRNDLARMRELIQQGVNINNANGLFTPLAEALLTGRDDAAILLINQPNIDLDIRTPNGSTPLHLAAEANQLYIANLLINRGADIDALDNNDDTPLHRAAEANDMDMVQMLLDNGANRRIENLQFRFPSEMSDRRDIADYILNYEGPLGPLDIKEPDSDYD